MTPDRIDQAAQVLADKAEQEHVTVSELFYRMLEKSDEITPTASDVALRACEILEERKP